MTRKTKQELIAQIVATLNAVIEVENEQQITEQKSSAAVEMLTIKECTETVKGLSEHTIRQLVAQEKIPFISTDIPLWNYPVRKGAVLYLALEDDYRRLQERMYRMFGTESTDSLFFATSANQLGKGLGKQLQGFIREHPDTRLIIIDT